MNEVTKHAPNRMPDGSTYVLHFNGLPSGLLQTQLTDSMCNLVITICILTELGVYSPSTIIKVLGDDSIIGLETFIPVDKHNEFFNDYAAIAKRRFNMEVSPLEKKSIMTNNLNEIYVLGYYNNNGFPTRKRLPLLAALVHRERPFTYSELRGMAIGIAFASAGYDQTVYDVCRTIFYSAEKHGFEINSKAFERDSVIRDVLGITPQDFDHFPTVEEISYRLFTYPSKDLSRIWKEEYFISDDLNK